MSAIPRPALTLGLAGLLPFVAGALAIHGSISCDGAGANLFVQLQRLLDSTLEAYCIDNPVTGYLILQSYGSAILAFMGGCFWGFAAQAGRGGWPAFSLAVIPGLWAFGSTFAPDALLALMLGYIVLLVLDALFRAWSLGPDWWLWLRLPLTAVVLICLGLGWAA